MPNPEFEEIKPEDRRFELIKAPEKWDPKLTEEQLNAVDAETAARWKLHNVLGQQIEWLIDAVVHINNSLYHLESEIIRSRQFRSFLWTRITLVLVTVPVITQVVIWLFANKILHLP